MRLVGLDADGPTDAALLVAVALGDEGACRTFVDRHSSRVFGVALAVCRDRSLAEDVAQRAFEQAWRHAASYDPDRASARTWLLTITRRLAIDEVRRRRPIPLGPDDLDAALAPSGSDTERTGLEAMERDRVAAALAELPESQRRAVVFAGPRRTLGERDRRDRGDPARHREDAGAARSPSPAGRALGGAEP